MKERGILMAGSMVRATLAGTKTQTRRLARLERGASGELSLVRVRHGEHRGSSAYVDFDGVPGISWRPYGGAPTQPYPWPERCCPYQVGDKLWVRETWAEGWTYLGARPCVFYRATGDGLAHRNRVLDHDPMEGASVPVARGSLALRWRPSIHMPRWASRLTLEVTDVRVQRLQNISAADIDAEGIDYETSEDWSEGERLQSAGSPVSPERYAFACLWNSIYGKRAPWDSNPYVWAITFKVLDRTKGAGGGPEESAGTASECADVSGTSAGTARVGAAQPSAPFVGSGAFK